MRGSPQHCAGAVFSLRRTAKLKGTPITQRTRSVSLPRGGWQSRQSRTPFAEMLFAQSSASLTSRHREITSAEDQRVGMCQVCQVPSVPGNSSDWGCGAGNGPWIMSDLEDGLWAGNERVNPESQPIHADFVTAMVEASRVGSP